MSCCNRESLCFFLAAATVTAAVLIGCAGQDAAPPTGAGQASEAWKAGLDEQAIAAISELSESDRDAALGQKACPVSDMALGPMGKPLKVTIDGRDVFLCCDGCEEQIKNESAKFLAKLNEPN